MKNIVIINQPLNNRGDEAAHKSLVRHLNLKFPSVKIIVIFMHETANSVEQMQVKSENNLYVNITDARKGTGRYLPKLFMEYIHLLPFANFHPAYSKYIKLVKNADLIINAPGGICMGGFQNWQHIFYLKLALKYNHRVLTYGRSIGPFPEVTKDNKIFKKRSLEILSKLESISLRDAKSIQLAEELKIQYIRTIDTAFLDVPKTIIPANIINKINGDYIVFVPNSLTWHPAYKMANQEIIDDLYTCILKYILQNKDYKIIMLPQLFNDHKKPDETYFHKLKNAVPDNRIIVLPEKYSSDIQQAIISNSKLVIGARYHSIVFAINNRVPFIALSYEHKIEGLLNILNLDKYNINISNIGYNYIENTNILQQINTILNTEKISYEEIHNIAHNIAQKCFESSFNTVL